MRHHYLPFLLAAVILLTLFSSCITQKRRAKICQTCATKKEVKDSIVYKTTVTPYDTTALIKRHQGKDQTYSNCDSLLKELTRHHDTLVTKENGIRSVITKKGNGFTFHCETDSLKEIIGLLRIQNETLSFHKERIEVPVCNKRHITDDEIFWIKIGKWLLGILIAYILLRLLKIYLKKSFPVIAKFIP